MAILLQEKNFGPNVIYYFFGLLFWMSGGPRADEVDLEVDFGIVLRFLFIYNTFASGPPQVDL